MEIFVRVRKVIPWRCLCALRPSGEKQLGDVLRHRLRPLGAKDLHFVLSHIAKSKKISTRRPVFLVCSLASGFSLRSLRIVLLVRWCRYPDGGKRLSRSITAWCFHCFVRSACLCHCNSACILRCACTLIGQESYVAEPLQGCASTYHRNTAKCCRCTNHARQRTLRC